MIIHIVQPGDSLSIIATRFNVSVREIIEDNWVGMGSEMLIVPGQILFIRGEDHKHTQGNVESTDPFSMLYPYIKRQVFYVVQRGDTLAAIARRFDTTVEAIVEANNLAGAGELIFPGQILRI